MNYDKHILLGGISMIESGNNDLAVGDMKNQDGPALGRFQIHQSAWTDISKIRKAKGQPTHPYHDAYKRTTAESYAATLVDSITDEFIKHHGCRPSPSLLYVCYSLGPSIIPKIQRMVGVRPVGFAPNKLLVCPSIEATLWALGYSTSLSRRKASQGKRYEDLIVAHYLSVRDLGIPLIK
jgi:hypothetical protein